MIDALVIYEAYPRRVGRRKALLEIEHALKRLQHGEPGYNMTEKEAHAFLLAATKEFGHSPAGNRERFTPLPTTWFHQARYLDDRNDWQLLSDEEAKRMRMQREANIGR